MTIQSACHTPKTASTDPSHMELSPVLGSDLWISMGQKACGGDSVSWQIQLSRDIFVIYRGSLQVSSIHSNCRMRRADVSLTGASVDLSVDGMLE